MSRDNDELRDQVEFTKEFLEWSHGMALRNRNSDKAYAFNSAIGLVDDALEKNWDVASAVWDDRDLEFIEESREAREEGIKAATLHEESVRRREERYGNRSFLDRLLSWIAEKST